jgi:very-short-patch-repair endonuclease
MLLIEIDGGYYHSDPRVVKEDKLNPMQKHNKRVDEYKDKWALLHGIPLIRIWEKDIRENPKGVMKELKKRLYIEDKRVTLTEKKNKRHVNKIK